MTTAKAQSRKVDRIPKKAPVPAQPEVPEEVRILVAQGKERGYLVYDDVNDALPAEYTASVEKIEELYEMFSAAGIEMVDSEEQGREKFGASGKPVKTEAQTQQEAR